MQEFFIKSFEVIIAVAMVLVAIIIVIAGFGAASQQGILAGLATWIGGSIYLLFMGGMTYLFLGTYHNTRRTAEAVEKLVAAQTYK